jgi:hypothetical protein
MGDGSGGGRRTNRGPAGADPPGFETQASIARYCTTFFGSVFPAFFT